MDVTLEPMTADRFVQWREQEITEFAKDKVKASVWPEDKAMEASAAEIAIDEEHQGKGLGRSLLAAAESRCAERGVKVVRLNVFAFNMTAISLYESSGYTVTDLRMMKRIGAP